MNDAYKWKRITAKMKQKSREFLAYLATVPVEWKGEADSLHQDGLTLADIQDTIAAYQEPAEYPLRLTRYELDILAGHLLNQANASHPDQAILAKMDALQTEIEALRKAAPAEEPNRLT